MSSKEDPPSKSTLEAVQKQFEHWRANRKRRGPIPEELWVEAISLTDDHPLVGISKALRLNYNELKRRVEEHDRTGTQATQDESGFVEVDMGNALMSTVDCVVEVQDAKGAKLAIQYRGPQVVDLLDLARQMWQERS